VDWENMCIFALEIKKESSKSITGRRKQIKTKSYRAKNQISPWVTIST
jgi:hypothetical protein